MSHRHDRTGERVDERDLEELHEHPSTPDEIHAALQRERALIHAAGATLSDDQERPR